MHLRDTELTLGVPETQRRLQYRVVHTGYARLPLQLTQANNRDSRCRGGLVEPYSALPR